MSHSALSTPFAPGATDMSDGNRDPDSPSPSDCQRSTPGFLRQLKKTGHPIVFTINGTAELVVQDTVSDQKLIELAERAEELQITRRAVAEMKAGRGRPAGEMLAAMRRTIAEKQAQ